MGLEEGALNPTADRAQEWGPTESGAGVLKTQSQGCPILSSVFTVLSLATEGKKKQVSGR